MRGSKIINLLNSFSIKELKSFSEFVASPYHNKNVDVSRLLDFIIKYFPDLPAEGISKGEVFISLFPGEKYEDKRVRYLMSDLLKLAENFLLVRKIEDRGVDVSLKLLDEFIDRNLDKHYNQLRNKLVNEFSKNGGAGVDLLFEKMKIADLEEKHFARQRKREFDDKIQHGSDLLNRYYVLKKLKYSCGMLDRQALLKGAYELDLPDNWLEWLETNNFWDEKIIKMYATVFLALRHEEDPAHFEALNKLLHEDNSGISESDLKELFLYAINYCVRKIRKGEVRFIETALNLYLEGIKEKVLTEDGYLSPWTFGNVVKLALRLEKYEWIEAFIANNKHQLPPDFQENTMQYNLAELYCYKKDFDTALTFLHKVEFSDLSYHLGSRIMLSKIYYELDEGEALLSLMSSFVMFLKRNKKMSESIHKTCQNFCDLLFLIIRGKVQNIEEKIQKTTLLTDREWLLEKVREWG
jgi:hypothetical protein